MKPSVMGTRTSRPLSAQVRDDVRVFADSAHSGCMIEIRCDHRPIGCLRGAVPVAYTVHLKSI